MKDGIINVYKEKGYTSFDVVAILRRILKIRKIGHTGTLDPEAEGVLPVCIGKATKTVEFLTDKTKLYAASFELGITTDTQDNTGNVISVSSVCANEEDIIRAVKGFIGTYSQIPPMYSAVKVNGRKLYELAREGKTVERKPREVNIYSIDDITVTNRKVFMRVLCSKGTYIRTLCHDIGERLGCGAHMTSLIREKSGTFEINQSLRLTKIEELNNNNELDKYILPIDEIYFEYEKVIIDPKYDKALYNGNLLKEDYLLYKALLKRESNYRIYDYSHRFIGIYCYTKVHDIYSLKPITLFL